VAVDHLGQRLAFGGARGNERLQHLVERGRERLIEDGELLLGLPLLFLLLDDATHAQQAVGRGCGRAGALAHLLDQGRQFGQQGAVDPKRAALALAREGERQRDVAALQPATDCRT